MLPETLEFLLPKVLRNHQNPRQQWVESPVAKQLMADFCLRSEAAQDAASKGYKKGKNVASDAADYASETAESAKETAADAASQAAAFINSYLRWGESKAKESKDSTSKSIQVRL